MRLQASADCQMVTASTAMFVVQTRYAAALHLSRVASTFRSYLIPASPMHRWLQPPEILQPSSAMRVHSTWRRPGFGTTVEEITTCGMRVNGDMSTHLK